jgi:hypothetical protein
MTTYATLTWESTPALWRAYTDPEGEQGFGKTKEEALDELIEQICEGMRESAKDAKLAELTRSLADSTAKLFSNSSTRHSDDRPPRRRCYGGREMIDEDRSNWTLDQLADEVIEACELPMGCRGTIIAALGDAKAQGRAEVDAYAIPLDTRSGQQGRSS